MIGYWSWIIIEVLLKLIFYSKLLNYQSESSNQTWCFSSANYEDLKSGGNVELKYNACWLLVWFLVWDSCRISNPYDRDRMIKKYIIFLNGGKLWDSRPKGYPIICSYKAILIMVLYGIIMVYPTNPLEISHESTGFMSLGENGHRDASLGTWYGASRRLG